MIEELRRGLEKWLEQTGFIKLPCGCLLTKCPGCGRWELVVGSPRCTFGDPKDPCHRVFIETLYRVGLRSLEPPTPRRPAKTEG